jgi:hypothetical protein
MRAWEARALPLGDTRLTSGFVPVFGNYSLKRRSDHDFREIVQDSCCCFAATALRDDLLGALSAASAHIQARESAPTISPLERNFRAVKSVDRSRYALKTA